MPNYSKSSHNRLMTCDVRLIHVFTKVITKFDHTIICGHRIKIEQDTAFANGHSKVQFPNSKHNKYPSKAVDAGPYVTGRGIIWPDKKSKYYIKDVGAWHLFAGYVLATAGEMGIKLRWGGDWDRDWNLIDQRFDDLPHFEIVE